MSSSRLPGKMLMDICGKPLFLHVLERARAIRGVDDVILATSIDKSDDELVEFAKDCKVKVFRGSLENVAKRAIDCAVLNDLDAFIRICGDRPFFDPNMIDSMLLKYRKYKPDIATNAQFKTYPAGMTVEIISTQSLIKAFKCMVNELDKEHITQFFYQNTDLFKIYNKSWNSPKEALLSFVIDTKLDLDKARWIAFQIKDRGILPMEEMIALIKIWKK